MTEYNSTENTLELGADDALEVGEYEVTYSDDDDSWQARYDRPIGGERGAHGEIKGAKYTKDSQIGVYSVEFSDGHTIEVPDKKKFDETTTFSISGWFKAESYNSDFRIFSKYAFSSEAGYSLQNQGNNGLTLLIGDGTRNRVDLGDISNNPPAGQWNHLVGTYDGSTMHLYVNNVEESTTSISTTVDVARVSGFIGGPENEIDYNGNIDDVRFYDRALSASEVTDLFNGVDVTNGLVAHYDFEYPETPEVAIDSTGDPFPLNNIPRSTDESIVPRGLAESVAEGKALADDGEMYDTVQAAVDAASGWVFVGPGTFNESVSITTDGLAVKGCGYDSLIDGGTSGDAILVDAADVIIQNISCRTDSGQTDNYNGVQGTTAASGCTVDNVNVIETAKQGVEIPAPDAIVANCHLETTSDSSNGIRLGDGAIIRSCLIDNFSNGTNNNGDDIIIAGNIITDCSNRGMLVDGDNYTVGQNRVINSGSDGIAAQGDNNIIYNNRVSGSGGDDISDTGTGNVLDDNLTG